MPDDLLDFEDVEGALRSWLRTHPLLVGGAEGHVDGRVFFAVPTSVSYPLITVSRIGGGPQEGLAPLDDARLSMRVYGQTKSSAQKVTNRLVTALQQIEAEPLNGSVFGHGARVDSQLWLPDPADDCPRYIVDATITVSAIPA